MDFSLTEERRMLQDSVRGTLERHSGGEERALWRDLAELGAFSALFNEEQGGFGGAGFDIAVLFEEFGRAGVALPVADHAILAGGLLAACDTQGTHAGTLAAIMEGATQAAFAHEEPESAGRLASVATRAEPSGEGTVRLHGHKAMVFGGTDASYFLVTARTGGDTDDEDGISLFLVAADAPGVDRRAVPLIGGDTAAEILLEGVEVIATNRIGTQGTAFAAIRRAEGRAILAACAEMLGLMERVKALTLDYVRTRRQFGKPIGAFQALQHRLADMLIEIEQSRSAVINLAGRLDGEDRERQASAAKNLVGRTARLVAEESIQLHGGIGMTEEYELGHLTRRLLQLEMRFGDADHHLQRFITLSRPRWGAEAA